jgi:hypothetical protein
LPPSALRCLRPFPASSFPTSLTLLFLSRYGRVHPSHPNAPQPIPHTSLKLTSRSEKHTEREGGTPHCGEADLLYRVFGVGEESGADGGRGAVVDLHGGLCRCLYCVFRGKISSTEDFAKKWVQGRVRTRGDEAKRSKTRTSNTKEQRRSVVCTTQSRIKCY